MLISLDITFMTQIKKVLVLQKKCKWRLFGSRLSFLQVLFVVSLKYPEIFVLFILCKIISVFENNLKMALGMLPAHIKSSVWLWSS